MLHTHNPAFGRVVSWHRRWKWGWKGGMRMRWKWKWDERLTGTRGGERKRRGKEQTHTSTLESKGKEKRRPTDTSKHTPAHLARSGQTLKAREKKSGGRRTRDQRRGGRRKRLNQPDTAKTYAYLGTRRTRPTWGGKNAWNRGPNGELVGEPRKTRKVKGDPVQT